MKDSNVTVRVAIASFLSVSQPTVAMLDFVSKGQQARDERQVYGRINHKAPAKEAQKSIWSGPMCGVTGRGARSWRRTARFRGQDTWLLIICPLYY
jgi:hypothetical protein